MKKSEVKEILKKCFGKNKDDRYHAIAMLIIYAIFLTILILLIRLGGIANSSSIEENNSNNNNNNNNNNNSNNSIGKPADTSGSVSNEFDINYSYSYTVIYNDNSAVFLGKKIDEKEKITYIKDGITTEYAILNDNLLILENGNYHIATKPSNWFHEYCDIETILLAIENEISTSNGIDTKYIIPNTKLASVFNDTLTVDNERDNNIIMHYSNDILKVVEADFSNYVSAVKGEVASLIIKMEFADIGTTDDFVISFSN